MINKKIKFRTLSILLILMLCASLLAGAATPVYGDSEEPVTFTEDGFTYQITKEAEKEVAITKYVGTDTTLTIPRVVTHENEVYKITSIGRSAFDESDITKVALAEGWTGKDIALGAFAGCKNLEKVTLPKSLTSVSVGMFMNCSSLRTIDLSKVTKIGDMAFWRCEKLEDVTLSEATEIGEYAFNSCTSLSKVTLGKVIEIKERTFNGCTSLSQVTLGEVTEIGTSAFYDCSSLQTIDLSKVTKIESSAFNRCASLTQVELLKATEIGDNAFYGCSKLNNVTLSKELRKDKLGSYAFTACESLTTINVEPGSADFAIQDGVLYALSEDQLLEELIFCPTNQSGAFTVPGTVKIIANSAFEGCRNLTEIKLNEGLEAMGYWAFADCTGLTTLHIPSTMPAMDSYCFNGCTNLESITVADGNRDLYAVDGVLYDGAFDGHTALRCYPAGKTGTEYTVAEGTAEIEDGAFFGNAHLEKVVVGSEVTEIGADTFSNCTSLQEITLPQSLTSVGDGCFQGCTALKELYIPKNVTTIGADAFEGCSDIMQITLFNGVSLYSGGIPGKVLIVCDDKDQPLAADTVDNLEEGQIYRAVRQASPSAYIAKGTQYDLEKLLSMTDTIYEGPTGTDVYTGEDIKLPLYMEGNKSDDTILSGRTLTVGAGEWGNLAIYPYTTKENIQLRFPSPVIPVEPDKPDVNVEKKPDGSTITTTTEKDAKTGVESRTEVVKDKNGKTTASVQITAPAKTVTSNVTTTAEVSKAAADKLVEQAKAAEKAAADAGAKKVISTITLEASAGSEGETAAKVEIVMPTDVVKQIAEQTEANLKVVTSAGEITLDNKALAKVAEEAEGETLKLIVEKVKKEALPKAVRAKIDERTMVLDFCAETSAGKISSFGGGKVTISLEIPEAITGSVKVMHLDDKGKATEVKGKIVTNGGRRFYQFTTNHFSYYAVADAKTVDRAVAATAKEKNAKIKKGVQATTIKASSKSGKGYIRVNWKKSYGYKVDGFQVYRATKSKGKYTRIWTGKGTAKTVKNSKNLKKGVRYYYKVRGFRKVDGKTIYTRWSNKTHRIAR